MADPVVFEFLHAEIVKHIMEEKDEKTGKVKMNPSFLVQYLIQKMSCENNTTQSLILWRKFCVVLIIMLYLFIAGGVGLYGLLVWLQNH
jgi:nitrate reductase NapE component